MIELLVPKEAAKPKAPYTFATKANGFIFVSGVVSLHSDGTVSGLDDAAVQTRTILTLIRAALELDGGALENIVHAQIFLSNLADYGAMNDVWREFFPDYKPARYVINAGLVRPEFLVEVSATAVCAGNS